MTPDTLSPPASLPLIVIAGPTGSGKSKVAVGIAKRIGGEIVNYDSIQIYKGFDLGSAKPPATERGEIPHHLYDVVRPDEHFTAADFASMAQEVCSQIADRNGRAILAGGTGFYLRALLSGLPVMPPSDASLRQRLRSILAKDPGPALLHRWLSTVDPISGQRIAPGDRHRVERALEVYLLTGNPISSWKPPSHHSDVPHVKYALQMPRDQLVAVLEKRVDLMYEQGLIAETERLLSEYGQGCRPFESIGYRECVRLLRGEMTRDAAIDETKRRTRAYAKRQMTWLRSEQNLHWIDASAGIEAACEVILRMIETDSASNSQKDHSQ